MGNILFDLANPEQINKLIEKSGLTLEIMNYEHTHMLSGKLLRCFLHHTERN